MFASFSKGLTPCIARSVAPVMAPASSAEDAL
jgi:hypothetical protein